MTTLNSYKFSLRELAWMAAIAIGYVVLANTVLYLFSVNGVVSTVWPSSGLALAALLIGGIRLMPGVFVGALVANVITGLSFGMASAIAMGNTMEAILGFWLLTRNGKFDTYLTTLRDYLRLLVLAGFVACGIAALNGSTTLLISGFINMGDFLFNLLHWWMGDVLGIVLITPLILTCRRMPEGWREPKWIAGAILLFALFFMVNQIVFLEWFRDQDGILEQIFRDYWMFLLIVVVAISYHTQGVALALVMTAIQALEGVNQGVGFFAHDFADSQLISFWFYMITLSAVGMALAGYYAERKQSRRLLVESEEQYRLLISSMAEGVTLQDANSAILAFNKSAERILGLTADQLFGRTSLDPRWYSIHEDGSPFPGETHPVVMALKTGMPQSDVIMGIHKPGGELTWISVNVQPIFKAASTTPYRVVATMRDITEHKRAEQEAFEMREQLAQATKMESIGHLTAGIAHDFNNMLGAMMGYTELSQHMLSAGKRVEVLPYQEEILKAGTRAKELIAQMLSFSRPSSDKQGEPPPVIQLALVVKEVVVLLRSSIPSTVDLNYQIEEEDLKARIQPVHLHQILLNLGVNARDAMGEYGKIDVTLSRYHADNQLCSACKHHFSGDYAKITVKDSGSGIPESAMNKIFDPFFTTKSVGKGTGMGLSVVHGLVRAAGGHILVESSVANGTSFNILLPLELSAPGLQQNVEIAKVGNLKGIHIMVVDDALPLATMLHEYLTAYGAHVVSFTDPIMALEAFVQNVVKIDLVITDEAMPGISGMLLAEKLLKLRPNLPIILCTGYSDHANPETAANIGIAGFFHKPLNMKELMEKIQILCAAKI